MGHHVPITGPGGRLSWIRGSPDGSQKAVMILIHILFARWISFLENLLVINLNHRILCHEAKKLIHMGLVFQTIQLIPKRHLLHQRSQKKHLPHLLISDSLIRARFWFIPQYVAGPVAPPPPATRALHLERVFRLSAWTSVRYKCPFFFSLKDSSFFFFTLLSR